jgi:hypothetical protein
VEDVNYSIHLTQLRKFSIDDVTRNDAAKELDHAIDDASDGADGVIYQSCLDVWCCNE